MYIRDPYQQKRLQRILGRELTPDEKDGIRPIRYRQDGQHKREFIRKIPLSFFFPK